ncbi:head GIN domain-containing protein [Candidatus Neomarinimicrobiota bacterium]
MFKSIVNNYRIVTSLIIIVLSFSCDLSEDCIDGSGNITTKTLALSSLEGIDFAIAGDVIISQGNVQSVVATGHPNIISDLKKKMVSGNIWVIEFEEDCYDKYELTLHITVPNISDISLSGSGTIILHDFIDQNNLSLDISGSGDIDINAFSGTEKLTVDISGSGAVSGDADLVDLSTLNINISGAGNYNGFPIKTDDCSVNISGSGNCYVNVIDNLDIIISGSGNIYYKGNPTININNSGSGSIINSN